MTAPVLEVEGIYKHFGAIEALRGVSLSIYPGEVVGLVGDNGAGKSTFVRVLSGAVVPDRGTIKLRQRTVRFASPIDARKQGIETVYQDLALAPHLSVAANLFLGRESVRAGFLSKFGFLHEAKMYQTAHDALSVLRIQIPSLYQPVGELSGGQRQAVAVARAVFWGSAMAILDEPTAALGVEESAMVLDLIRRVRDKGVPVLLVSHTMPHVMDVTDRVVVLRRGEVVATARTRDCSMDEIITWITGSTHLAGAGGD